MGLAYMYAAFILIPVFAWLMLWSYQTFIRRAKDSVLRPQVSDEINTVIFDIGNVLVNFAWEEYYRAHHFPEDIHERIVKATVHHPAWKEFDLGNLTYEEIIDGFIRNDPGIEKELRQVFFAEGRLRGLITKRERAVPWVKEMQAAGYTVLYLSNYSEMALEDCRDQMDFLDIADGGLLSYTEHMIKPDPAYYRLLIDKYDLIPAHAVFIDDMRVNVEAATALGMHGIVFETQEQAERDLRALGVTYG